MSDLVLRAVGYDAPEAQALVAEVQQEYVVRYGGPDETPVDPAEFTPPAGHFVVAFLDGTPVACGGFRTLGGGDVEVKRMYVVPGVRGRGFARVVLAHLEDVARARGAGRVVLETGARQPEAMRLYESSGYDRIPGFGHYRCEPLSVSYAKPL